MSHSSTHASLGAGGVPPPPPPPPPLPPPPEGALGVNLDCIDMDLDGDQPDSAPRAGTTPRAARVITNQPGQPEEKREKDFEVR